MILSFNFWHVWANYSISVYFQMAHRYGQFFQEPDWPYHTDENNPRYANFDNDYDQDAPLCKIEEPDRPEFIKIEFYHEESVIAKKEEQCSEMEGERSLSQSEYIATQSQYSQNITNNKKMYKVKFEPEDIFAQKGLVRRLRPKQTTSNPLRSRWKRPKKEYERGKYKILSEQIKKQIVQESRSMTMVQVAKKYHVSVNNICRWRKRCDRRSGAGRKVTDMAMQNKLLDWLLDQKHPIPRKQVQSMAKKMSGQDDFKASKGWFQRFYKRNRLLYNPNVQILTHNDYRQRLNKEMQLKAKAQAKRHESPSNEIAESSKVPE